MMGSLIVDLDEVREGIQLPGGCPEQVVDLLVFEVVDVGDLCQSTIEAPLTGVGVGGFDRETFLVSGVGPLRPVARVLNQVFDFN